MWANYWDGPAGLYAPHRNAILAELEKLPPFRSVLEVGCGPLVNLARIRQRWPDVHLSGFDVSESALELGMDRFIDAGLAPPQDLSVGQLPDAIGEDDRYDVVLSVYTLAYLEPARIRSVLDRIAMTATQAILFAEPMATLQLAVGLIKGHPPLEWSHDYVSYFRDDAPPQWRYPSAVQRFAVIPEGTADRMNRLLIIRKAQ
jgi:SAM-dependent methyltransferase